MSRVRIDIGPVPAALALRWVENGRRLVAGVRRHASVLSIEVRPEMLDLCEALLDVLESTAERGEPFHWTAEVESEPLHGVALQWLEIGSLTDRELELIGCRWAPPETRPFSDAVAAGVLSALERAGESGRDLLARMRTQSVEVG